MLTRKQAELLVFINSRLETTGVSPSFDEMKDALSLKSKSGVHRLITALTERGFIRRLPHRARALEVLKMPDSATAAAHALDIAPLGMKTDDDSDGMARFGNPAHADRPAQRGFSPNVIPGNFPKAVPPRETPPPAEQEGISLPLYGRIAAGTPIEALRDHSATVDVPASMVVGGEHYALEVAGDSMIEAGILDGDTAIIRRCDTAENGTIVVALIDDAEATLKRLRRRSQAIALEPANPSYETRIFRPDQVKIQGRLIGLMRRY